MMSFYYYGFIGGTTIVRFNKFSINNIAMEHTTFHFNEIGAYAKIYHDKSKEYGCLPEDVKLLMNSCYGLTGLNTCCGTERSKK